MPSYPGVPKPRKGKANRVLIKQILDLDYETVNPFEHGAYDAIQHEMILMNLGLPRDLIQLIKRGELETAIDEAYEKIDRVNEMLDEWEERNPTLAPLTPWYRARQEWKAAGRPKAPWYEVLLGHNYNGRRTPLAPSDLDMQLTHEITKRAVKAQRARQLADRQRSNLQLAT